MSNAKNSRSNRNDYNKNKTNPKNKSDNSPANLDMINRDPNSLNQFVKVLSSDVLAEPDDENVHSNDW